MKKILTSLILSLPISAIATVGDSGQVTTVFFTNSSGEDVKLVSANPANDSGYAKFNCLYPIPRKYQDLPSPAFKTMTAPGSNQQATLQYTLIPAGATVAYAFSSSCDDDNNIEKSERFSIRSAQYFERLYVNLGNMHQDINKGVIEYTKYLSTHAIWGDVVSPPMAIVPFHVTVLPINQ